MQEERNGSVMSDIPFKIKELLSTGEAYTVREMSRLLNRPVTTIKRALLKKLAGVVSSGRIKADAQGCPIFYWMSPSKYDEYDEPMTKMEIVKELLRSGEELSYLTFGNKQDGDPTVYTYVKRLQAMGWNIERVKNGGERAVFRLVGEPGPDIKHKRGPKGGKRKPKQAAS